MTKSFLFENSKISGPCVLTMTILLVWMKNKLSSHFNPPRNPPHVSTQADELLWISIIHHHLTWSPWIRTGVVVGNYRPVQLPWSLVPVLLAAESLLDSILAMMRMTDDWMVPPYLLYVCLIVDLDTQIPHTTWPQSLTSAKASVHLRTISRPDLTSKGE